MNTEKDQADGAAHVADQNCGDVLAQLHAAYSYDKLGDERRSLRYYEAALSLTLPNEERKKFSICYGSTLTNVGRSSDAILYLTNASEDYPDSPEVWAFLSLALREAGRFEEAYSALLKALVTEAGDSGLGGFRRAIAEYLEEIEIRNRSLTP